MYALKAPTCPHDQTSSTYPFQSCKELSPRFCAVFLMHASSSMLGRSPVDCCCDQCQFPLLGLVLGPVLGAVLGPVLGTTIRIERTGAKTEAKTGPKSGPRSGTNFAKLFAHFFRHAANRCPQWSCPCFATFAFFLFARILARILRQPAQAKLAATGKRTRASVSKPNLCPSNNYCSRHPNCTRSNKPYNVQEFDAAVYRIQLEPWRASLQINRQSAPQLGEASHTTKLAILLAVCTDLFLGRRRGVTSFMLLFVSL